MFVADVFDVIMRDKATKDVIASTTLQSANIEATVTENEIRGGKGNNLLGILHVSRDINVPLTDAEFKYEWLAKQLGQDIKTGAGVAWAMPKWYTVEESLDFTLEATPTDKASVAIYDKDGARLALDTDFTVTDNKILITKAGIETGDKVEVRTFQYTTPPTTQIIEIDNAVFAKGVELILETIEISGDEIPVAKIQYQFDSAVPTGNFTINTASERTAQAQQFDLRIIKPTDSTVVGRAVRIPL